MKEKTTTYNSQQQHYIQRNIILGTENIQNVFNKKIKK